MDCPKPIPGPEFQLSKRRSTEISWQQSVSVPKPLNANERCLSTPAWRAATLNGGLGATTGSGLGGTDPFMLLKQSNVKWLAHTYNVTQPLSLLLFCSWDRI